MRKEVEHWWMQSKDDLEKAEVLANNAKYDGAVFFCQQSVEKALKALFILNLAKSPGPTHSLIYLAKELNLPKEYFVLLQELTPEFVTTRYPDVVGETPCKLYSKEKTAYYITKSKELLKWIENQINKR